MTFNMAPDIRHNADHLRKNFDHLLIICRINYIKYIGIGGPGIPAADGRIHLIICRIKHIKYIGIGDL